VGRDRAPFRARTGREPGFTFLEILVVMGIAAVLLGLGVGFLRSVGRSSLSQQAAAILAESAQRCLNESAGGGRAVLELRTAKDAQGEDRIEVRTAVQRAVLSANFETAPTDRPDIEWFVYANGPELAKPTGPAKLVPDGHDGGAVSLEPGAFVEFGERSAFAMTDGMEVDLWVRPSPMGRGVMTLVRSDVGSQVLWLVQLVRDGGQSDGWRVALRVALVPADAPEGAPSAGMTEFRSKDAPVLAAAWSHVRVSYDGREPSIRVNGVERWERPASPRGRAEAGGVPMRLAAAPGGVARLVLSAPDASFVGLVDTLNVAGIFRSDEDARWLPLGITLFRTPLPVIVAFQNGRLDPTVHGRDVELRLQGPGDEESGGWQVVRFGLYGNIPPPYRFEPSLQGRGGGS
jgi:prepilin-type N-terminal cleavage/methylation domain-containing protein